MSKSRTVHIDQTKDYWYSVTILYYLLTYKVRLYIIYLYEFYLQNIIFSYAFYQKCCCICAALKTPSHFYELSCLLCIDMTATVLFHFRISVTVQKLAY